jgi:hypothetical protein
MNRRDRLVEAIEKRKDEFGAIVFFTYLYHATYCGLLAAPARSVLVPTAHDEPPQDHQPIDSALAEAPRLWPDPGDPPHAVRRGASAARVVSPLRRPTSEQSSSVGYWGEGWSPYPVPLRVPGKGARRQH